MFLQLILHWLGDYVTQSDWMALNKSKRSIPCLVHCLIYTLPFLFILPQTLNPGTVDQPYDMWDQGYWILCCIFWTHFFIDRFSLAKYLIWLKNHLNPGFTYPDWQHCNNTGYYDLHSPFIAAGEAEPRPMFITVWLYIIVDNGLHIICNYLALKYL